MLDMEKKLLRSIVFTLFACAVTPGLLFSAVFDGTADATLVGGGDNLVFTGGATISLTGERVIKLEGENVENKVTIGTATAQGAVTVRPNDSTDAQLVFDVEHEGSVLTVEVLNDLLFTSNDTGSKAMYVSFRGPGKTRFRLPSGQTISFGPQNAASSTVGTIVRVLMDQSRAQAADHAMVSFEKWSLEEETGLDAVNLDDSLHTWVKIGRLSAFEFVSPHQSGLPTDGITYGYSAVEFDPSNAGTGRLILDIAQGAADNDFKDGAFNVYGSRVTGTGGAGVTDVTTTDLRTGVTHKYRAGIEAAIRVTDLVAQRDATTWSTHRADVNNNRGLVVLNHNKSFPRLANNYEQVADLTTSQWFTANTYQTGFVVGNNGAIEIEDNRFLDYYADSADFAHTKFPVADTHVADGATSTSSDTHHASKVKKHNPAALIFDGNAFRKTGTTASNDANYEYDGTSIAQVRFRGRAGIFARVGASSSTSQVINPTMDASGNTSGTTYLDYTIGKGSYDGVSVPVLDSGSISAHQSLLGEIAVDIEGGVKFSSAATNDDAYSAAGYINIPTIMIDHRGKELQYSSSTLSEVTSRPLSTASTVEYYRYNTSNILVNDTVELHDTKLIHNDVGRDLSGLPGAFGSPAIIGGELPSLRVAATIAADPSTPIYDYTGSPIFLVNSTVELHESLVSAGVRWVVRDNLIDVSAGDTLATGNNTSHLVFYNRGDALDLDLTGVSKGRVFQLGSRAHTMADGTTLDPITLSDGSIPRSSVRDAYLDVYRQDALPVSLRPGTNTIKLKVSSAKEPGAADEGKAIQVIHLLDRSQLNLGWSAGQHKNSSDEVVVQVDSRYRPWEYTADVLDLVKTADPENTSGYRFAPYEYGVGTLELAADNICINAGGRYNSVGVLTPAGNELAPRSITDSGGIVFVDHGGRLETSGSSDVLVHTLIARRTSRIADAIGQISMSSDQSILLKDAKVQTYGYDATNDTEPNIKTGSLETMNFHVPDIPNPSGFTPVKGLWPTRGADDFLSDQMRSLLLRSTASVNLPVTKPSSGLQVISTGDSIEQAQISGATRATPFHLWVHGDGDGFGRVREFVSLKSDPAVLGEGAHAALFLSGGARIGLGSRRWNEHSLRAWNQLGQDKVSLFVHGNAVVDVNDDLVVVDRLPIIATDQFGKGAEAHEVLFYSDIPREIRILAGGELDLSSFGRGGTDSNGQSTQRIVFGGKIRLVVEPGGKIRFPKTLGGSGQEPVLYFNDQSKLIFLGNRDRDEGRWTDGLTGSDLVRCKVLGRGQIWLNKEARCEIFDEALVGMEADVSTPVTDITWSIRRDAGVYLGDEHQGGGAFQIGNMVSGGGDGSNTATPTQVNCKIVINGENARFHIGREGFFGIGAGTVNKINNPNGTVTIADTDPETDETGNQFYAWRVQSLFDVKNFELDIQQGYFDHNQIYNGSKVDSDGSVFALGVIDYDSSDPLADINGGKYTLKLGHPDSAYIRGGGAIVVIDAGNPHTAPYPLSIWDTAQAPNGSSDTGKYGMMAPGDMMRNRFRTTALPSNDTAYGFASLSSTTSEGTTTSGAPSGIVTAFEFSSRAVNGTDHLSSGSGTLYADNQGGAYIEFYNLLAMPVYAGSNLKQLPAGEAAIGARIGYLTLADSLVTIQRRVQLQVRDSSGNSVSAGLAVDKGHLLGSGISADNGPAAISLPNQ